MNPIRLSHSDLAKLFGGANPLAPAGKGRRMVKMPNPARRLAMVKRSIAWAQDQAARNPGPSSVFVAARLANHANGAQGGRGRARAIARERKSDRAKVRAACAAGGVPRTMPVAVRMVRLGAGTLDINGLWNALKSVMDGVADHFGPKDNDPGYAWSVDQEKTPQGCYGARIEFTYGKETNQ